MGKIKGWTKVIDSRMETQWHNKKRNHVVKLTKLMLWEIRIFDNDSQFDNKQGYRNNLSKTDATKLAMRYEVASIIDLLLSNTIGLIFVVIIFITYVMALVRQARMKQWVWFVLTLIISPLWLVYWILYGLKVVK